MDRRRLERIRDLYRRLDQTGQPVRLIQPTDEVGRPLQIVTIRHARPDLEKARRYSAGDAQQYIRDYDEAPIVAVEQPSFVLHDGEVSRIYTSALPRAILTAQAMFGDRFKLESLPAFNELERRIPRLPGRLPLRFWQILNRGLYFGGYPYRDIESFKGARRRIRQAAKLLITAAEEDQAAVLVAHGFFNYLLMWRLRRLGWRRVRRAGTRHLGVTVMVKD